MRQQWSTDERQEQHKGSLTSGFVGLFVEVTLIATFTQRFFGR
jgi:hypothetical protein